MDRFYDPQEDRSHDSQLDRFYDPSIILDHERDL